MASYFSETCANVEQVQRKMKLCIKKKKKLRTVSENQNYMRFCDKKKQVALIMLIIALQFDVSTSFNM